MLPGRRARERLRVALLGPPWIRVPPPGYEGWSSSRRPAQVRSVSDGGHGPCRRALEVVDETRQRGRGFDMVLFYRQYPERMGLSALSRDQLSPAPAGLRCVGAIPNPLYSPNRAISAVSGVGWPWCWPDRFRPASNLR
jgi:hypothetical protein